jgi:antitoxin VapB
MSIKNEEARRLAAELAELTGESLTTAVTTSIRERLDGVRCAHNGALGRRLVAIGKGCTAHLNERSRSIDHGDLLSRSAFGRPNVCFNPISPIASTTTSCR